MMKMETKSIQTKIESALEEIRPLLAMHLGDLEFVNFENGVVYVKMLGACQGCPLSQLTLKAGVEELLKRRVIGVKEVVQVFES